ncbi:MAG: DUF3038 domain-containing protein [Oscillatoriales cyanobacterium RM2_1_1]|nr:DUF3038 domain-containing protein [Oscillatoriales cyanobacterium SM2_3_0]NJO47400.1 DUF3038 domain-containing protein [Oscillatoriales cyanobacterium RM2_1_1]
MQLESSQASSTPALLESLPDFPISSQGCPRRVRTQIDLLLLAIEALYLGGGGGEQMLALIPKLDLQDVIQNRVTLWQIRSTNPLRRHAQRRPLSLAEAKSLVAIIHYLSRQLTVPIRQFLGDYHQLQTKQIPLEQHLQLSAYLERFRAHFRSRMNPRRAGVIAYSSPEKLNSLAMDLLEKLLFCTGTAGMQRLWSSLFDGEFS